MNRFCAHLRIPAALGLIIIAHATDSRAQSAAQEGEFSVQRFEPVAGPHNYLTVAGARMDGEWTWSTSLMFDYQRDPFVVKSCVSETDCSAAGAENPRDLSIVQDMLTWNVMGSLTPIPFMQIGLRVPVVYASGQGIDLSTGAEAANGLSGIGVGDVNLEAKFRFFGEPSEDGVALGAAADISAPVGHASSEGNFIGNASPVTGGVRAIVDIKVADFMAAANVRGVFKKNATFGDSTLGSELRWGAAIAYQVHDLFRPLVEGFGSTRFSGANGTNSIEIDGGIQLTPLDGMVVITAAGGSGLIKGIGVPVARGIFGVSFAYDAAADSDGDGVEDSDDQCPTDPEDLDNVQDSDGCPEDDVDHDKIPDEVDGCPLEAETENQYKDDDGCPDNPTDKDKDGVWDDEDKCPDAAGAMTRPEHRGCPDSDSDGVPDANDKCKDEAEDTDGFEDLDGCPDPDNDKDGVPDLQDECGDQPETMNGIDDADGCPD